MFMFNTILKMSSVKRGNGFLVCLSLVRCVIVTLDTLSLSIYRVYSVTTYCRYAPSCGRGCKLVLESLRPTPSRSSFLAESTSDRWVTELFVVSNFFRAVIFFLVNRSATAVNSVCAFFVVVKTVLLWCEAVLLSWLPTHTLTHARANARTGRLCSVLFSSVQRRTEAPPPSLYHRRWWRAIFLITMTLKSGFGS